MIEVQTVSKTYGKKAQLFTALDGVNFTIPDGASVAIVGKSGSGKSTLMHVMSGLDRISSGSIVINGEVLSGMRQKKVDAFRANEIGFIFQSFFVQANESCFDNVALALEIGHVRGLARKKRVMDALEKVELTDKVNAKAKNLSGGQKQRLAIARAIVNEPRILFADEPTGNLDSTTGNTIEKLLFNLNKKMGSTLVIVTHDEELAEKCDTRIFLKDGKIQKIINKKETKA
jgi:putative ABC transport system ATP-binding protein